MTKFEQPVRDGFFARKLLLNPVGLISWGHRGRMNTALKLVDAYAGTRALDYGSGDGMFLGMWTARATRPREAVGAELDPRVVDDCNRRFADTPGLRFVKMDALRGEEHTARYDLVTCMEVLEHVVDLEAVLDDLHRALAPRGTLIVSVPVETGLPLLVKQAARTVAGWRGVPGYASYPPYSLREYAASLFARDRQHIARPQYDGGGMPFHDHKGFNWMALRKRLAQDYDIVRQLGSPVEPLGPHLGSQAWFVARKKA